MKKIGSSSKSVNRGFNMGSNPRSGKKSAKSKILYPNETVGSVRKCSYKFNDIGTE